jgi:hypothetical protein
MNIEQQVKNVIEEKLSEGIIEKLVAENLEKGINESLKNLLGHYGDVTKVIEKNIKDVMIEQLSKYDYSKYIVKLDYVLTEILKSTALDNKKILENFKEFMMEIEIPKVLKVSEIFDRYCNYVAKNVDTSDLEVNTDDEPSYEAVNVSFEATEHEKKSWGYYSEVSIFFECEEDENMNFELKLKRWKDEKPWRISIDEKCELSSLRHLDEFKIYFIKLAQNFVDIEIDTWNDGTEVQPEAEPEASFN